jgi:hypothetical protein
MKTLGFAAVIVLFAVVVAGVTILGGYLFAVGWNLAQ